MKTDLYIILIIATAWLFAACSQETDMEPAGEIAQESTLPDASLQMVGLTRVALGETNFGDIRVLLNDGEATSQGVFKFDGVSEWTTRLKLKSGTQTYRTYGYMPDDEALSGSLDITDANHAVLHIQGLSPVSSQDYCIITGVRQAENTSDLTSASRGSFTFEYISSRQNYINLLFDHLYGHIVFWMKVNADYNAIRTVKIKSMQLQLPAISQASADITLTNGVGMEDVSYTVTGTSAINLDIRTTEITLSTTPIEIAGAYLAPISGVHNNVVLVTTYDLYDKQGNKVAERTATNKLSTPLNELLAGEERTLNVTVDPSYLYVLSDFDLNNPTIRVN